MPRDYLTEMQAIVNRATATPGYTPAVIASEITGKLRANDAELLAGWLDLHAENILRETISHRDRLTRERLRRNAGRHDFATAAEAHAAGDLTALHGYLQMPFTLADGTHQHLANLTRDDLLYVASDYERRAHENNLHAEVIRAIAKKVRKGTVKDHFTEEQLAAMFESIAA